MKRASHRYLSGFTIVELLIVIVVIAILAAVSVVAYTGIQSRAKDTVRQSDIRQVYKLIEAYYAVHGNYPITAPDIISGSVSATRVRTDANCNGGTQSSDWVPDLDTALPQSVSNGTKGRSGLRGCYMYASDGVRYVLSAWNNMETGPQVSSMYRRVGFREMDYMSNNGVFCNHSTIGGVSSGVYAANRDYYKYSYTISNVTSCNETPPAGA